MGTLHTHARVQPKVQDLFIPGGLMRIQIHPAEELILREAIHLHPLHQEEAARQNKEEPIHRLIVNPEVIADRLTTNRVALVVPHIQVLPQEVVHIALHVVAAVPAEVIQVVVPVAVPAVTPVPAVAVAAVAVIQAVPALDRVLIHPAVQVEVLHIRLADAGNI